MQRKWLIGRTWWKMPDFGPPFEIPSSSFVHGTGVIRVRRGGPNANSNSGSARPRFYTPNRATRVSKSNKSGTHHGGAIQPPVPRAPAIWNPRDPFIVEFQKAHANGTR